jgi:hypothetical protein
MLGPDLSMGIEASALEMESAQEGESPSVAELPAIN